MFIGQASTIGFAIEIPILIRSLANNLFFNNTNKISSNLSPCLRLMVALPGIINDNINTISTESFKFNWWDNDKVRLIFATLIKIGYNVIF